MKTDTALNIQIGGSHYKDCAIQPIQYIEANKLAFLEGCVVKRVTRHDKPTGKGRQDIEKSIHELQLLLEMRYPKMEADTASAVAATEEMHAAYRGLVDGGAAASNDWIEWTGGAQPVPFNTLVDLRFRDSETAVRYGASFVRWEHAKKDDTVFSSAFDVVAYRISQNG